MTKWESNNVFSSVQTSVLIPSEFQLGGFTWKVVRRKRLLGKYGDCNLATRTIRILDTIDQPLKEQTFLHELMHAIAFAMGINQEAHNEQEIDAFAMYLHQYMTSAKE